LGVSAKNAYSIDSRPITLGNNLIVTSQQGSVFAVSPSSGNVLWTKDVGGYPRQPVLFDNSVVIASSNGNITAFRQDGSIKWTSKVADYIYGIASGEKLYATTNLGLLVIDKSGNAAIIYNKTNLTYTAPAVGDNTIVFGVDDFLVAVRPSGTVAWSKQVAKFWKSNPVIDQGIIFIGALDNSLYAFDASDGFYRWKAETDGWILSTPFVNGATVYFGSNDGHIYSVSRDTGKLNWKVQTKEAVQSTPTSGQLAGKKVIFAGSNDDNLYAVDDLTGDLMWKQPVKGWVYSPFVLGKTIIFGSEDGRLYAISSDRACTIEYPEQDSIVGYKEIFVKGRAFTDYGTPSVDIRVNEGGWESAQLEEANWSYILDPKLYEFGLITIECKITDSIGQDKAPFTSLTLQRSQNAPKEKLNVVFPTNPKEGVSFNVSVFDQNNEPVLNYDIEFQGKKKSGSGSITLTPAGSGSAQLIVTKDGFDPVKITVNVTPANEMTWAIVGLAVLIIAAALFYFKRMRKK
jgi:outer membrane protein assembly factor BamB